MEIDDNSWVKAYDANGANMAMQGIDVVAWLNPTLEKPNASIIACVKLMASINYGTANQSDRYAIQMGINLTY
ncbi:MULTISPECIES: hypothetical protein [unclassified Coleofasciculus]|uniref:hypothetical protein n=1 Tax=unclassified Coleofasciculus TaxID=2692782 RepID=UPI00187E0104|nr:MULTISPECIES: hypothetical protein [unclassified Coleofasciculus]